MNWDVIASLVDVRLIDGYLINPQIYLRLIFFRILLQVIIKILSNRDMASFDLHVVGLASEVLMYMTEQCMQVIRRSRRPQARSELCPLLAEDSV